ncbi:hypothetical protein V8G54_006678 [Vigna mungo]|uniref:Uncharacterized protein n=1 Tax=Vigna mungo TaxID=3915 RepID=A0AAQ3P1Z7_VIGMU
MTKEAIDKLCRQHQYFSDLMNNKGKFGRAYKKSYLEIKCKDKCSCQNKKNKGDKPSKWKEKNLKFFKKKNFRKKSQGQRCYQSSPPHPNMKFRSYQQSSTSMSKQLHTSTLEHKKRS